MELFIYLILGVSSFFFVVVPVSGSFVINPLLAMVVEPHVAVSIASFFFFVNSSIKAFVFRREIASKYIKGILPISILGSALGALIVGYIPATMLLWTVFILSIHFLIKTLRNIFAKDKVKKELNKLELSGMSIMSGFLQGTGLGSGGGIRKQYLLAENLSLAEMNGTTSFISALVLLVSVVVRLSTGQVEYGQLLPVMYLIPVMVVATMLGRTVLKKMDKKIANVVILITMSVITGTFGYSLFM
ncbi:sulfite exporter TauE/SafE family protein [Candidatus Kaiserbacteria bacterium]|nr:sulfite exporter TauE/SafE family protein [Candidatus Kaiserbacteria bacterium]